MNEERNEEIYYAVEAGRTLKDIAKEHGISRERVRQIYSKIRREKAPEPKWVDKFPAYLKSALLRNGINSEEDLHQFYEKEQNMPGVSKRSLKRINELIETPIIIKKEKRTREPKTNYIGKKFGRLTVVKQAGRRYSNGERVYECVCTCGNVIVARIGNLKRGATKSCGCLRKEYTNSLKITPEQIPLRWIKAREGMTVKELLSEWESRSGSD